MPDLPESVTTEADRRAPRIRGYAYDPQRRATAGHYGRGRRRRGLVRGSAQAALDGLLLLSGGSTLLLGVATSHTGGPLRAEALGLLLYLLLCALVALPLSFLLAYRHERAFGLSTQSPRRWLRDWIKGLFIGVGLGLSLALGLLALIRLTPWWWLVAALLGGALVSLLATVAPTLGLRLFHRVRPLDDPPLCARVLEVCDRAGVGRVRAVLVVESSSSSTTANAMLTGLGRGRSIVLTDTMVRDFSPEEVEAVVAHELGHHVAGDVPSGIALHIALTICSLFVVAQVGGLLAAQLHLSLGSMAAMPLLRLCSAGTGMALTPLEAALSRTREERADRFALSILADGWPLASALRRLGDMALLEETPPTPWHLLASHPPLANRVVLAEGWPTPARAP